MIYSITRVFQLLSSIDLNSGLQNLNYNNQSPLLKVMASQEEKLPPAEHSLQIDSSLQNRRKRRSKNQASGRDFVCECGKSYLSYSALYTHSKVKHHSKITLEQTLYTAANIPRPLRFNFLDSHLLQHPLIHPHDYSLIRLQALIQTAKQELKEDFIKTAASKKTKINNVIFLEKYKKYWESRDKDDEVIDGKIYVATVDRALGYLLIKCEKALAKDEFNFFLAFVMKLRTELNELKGSWRYTEVTLVNELPTEMNELLATKFKGSDMFYDNPTLTVLLIYNICQWLQAEEFTSFQVKLNVLEEES